MSELIGYRFLTEASVLIFSLLGKALRVEVTKMMDKLHHESVTADSLPPGKAEIVREMAKSRRLTAGERACKGPKPMTGTCFQKGHLWSPSIATIRLCPYLTED